MMARLRFLGPAAALIGLLSAGGASAQGYGYDDGPPPPPPFHRGYGWDGPGWHRWHHRHGWRDGDFDRHGWRDGERGGPRRDRFGDDGPGRDDGPQRRGPRPGGAPSDFD